MFDIQQEGDVVIVVPQYDLREFEFGQIEAEGAEVLEILDEVKYVPTRYHEIIDNEWCGLIVEYE